MNNLDIIYYQECLSTIINTRLFYNTIDEYEEKLDNYSIHNNGVKRCFTTEQKLRSVFRDFQIEALKLTHNQVDLPTLLNDYKAAWRFYKTNLSRRRNAKVYVTDLLHYCYAPCVKNDLSDSKLCIFNQIISNKLNIPILVLMLLKILPGYDSKEGNVPNISQSFTDIFLLLKEFTSEKSCFTLLPTILQAQEEPHKSRLTLIYHTQKILDLYSSFFSVARLHENILILKRKIVDLDLDGFWNECSGTLDRTSFWEIRHAFNDGSYFITSWHKDGNNVLKAIKFSMNLSISTDNKLVAYVLHPKAITNIIERHTYTDTDNAWYISDLLPAEFPLKLDFNRLITSDVWPGKFNITRVTDDSVLETYKRWLCVFDKQFMFDELDYKFFSNIYAVTRNFIYIPTDNKNEYYQVPRNASQGLEYVQVGDLAGVMTLGSKKYIIFDDLFLFIEINKEQLAKYNIKIVDRIQ